VVWAAFFNFVAAFVVGTAVARTIGKGLIDKDLVTPGVVFSALIGASFWNVVTWLKGIPSSSSHALVGGLIGAVTHQIIASKTFDFTCDMRPLSAHPVNRRIG